MPSPDFQIPPVRAGSSLQRWFIGLIMAAIVLVLLAQARFFLIPLVIALLLFTLTSAAIERISRIRFGSAAIPTWLASIFAVAAIAAVLLALFGIISAQIDTVLTTALNYSERAQEALAAMFAWLGEGVAQSMLAAFQEINFGAYLRALAGSAGNLLLATVLIILYVGFLFAEQPWFDQKLDRLFPQRERADEVRAIIASITASIHHYLLVKTLVSAATALVVYALLIAIGLDFAVTLAILTFVFNFIPNIGSIVATALPTVVALVQFNDWTMVMLVVGTIGVVQFTIGNVIEPMLMGRTLHLSSFAIILSLTFWGAIWGVAGMFLAVPIMVTVMIVCSHIAALRPLAVMLSREGVLTPPERPEDEHAGDASAQDVPLKPSR